MSAQVSPSFPLPSSQTLILKKQRQTRIPEHLKTVKKVTPHSSPPNSTDLLSSSSNIVSTGQRKPRAAPPKKSSRKLEAVIEAQAAQQGKYTKSVHSADSLADNADALPK